jgi:hypothetical protein
VLLAFWGTMLTIPRVFSAETIDRIFEYYGVLLNIFAILGVQVSTTILLALLALLLVKSISQRNRKMKN